VKHLRGLPPTVPANCAAACPLGVGGAGKAVEEGEVGHCNGESLLLTISAQLI
jgi:hypothetical protein